MSPFHSLVEGKRTGAPCAADDPLGVGLRAKIVRKRRTCVGHVLADAGIDRHSEGEIAQKVQEDPI